MRSEQTNAGNENGDYAIPAPLRRISGVSRLQPRLVSSIGWRLLVRVLFLSSVITLFLTMMQLYFDYRRDVHAIDLQMAQIDSSYRPSLAEGIWRVDPRQVRLQLDAISRLPGISYVELREATNSIAPIIETAGARQADPPARREINIYYTNKGTEQLLGVLVIEATFNQIYQRLFDTAIIIMVGQAIKTFIVSFFILLLVHRLVTRHLVSIATSLKANELRGSQPLLRLERRMPQPADELDDLVEAFNQREMALCEAEQRNRDAQGQLAHANRIATMGQIAASIVHEVNQPIGATLVNAGTARRWLAASPPELTNAIRALDRIAADTKRAANIVDRMRDFARKEPARLQNLEIGEVVLQIIELVRGETSNNTISLKTNLTDGLPRIWGDRVQLQQVILNLMMNAIEAISENVGGLRELLITTAEAENDSVLVSVSDTGPGFPDVNSERIFEPFYTTKARGLGMGLSICRSIIEAHGGRLWATPNEPRGAVFQIMLPVRERVA